MKLKLIISFILLTFGMHLMAQPPQVLAELDSLNWLYHNGKIENKIEHFYRMASLYTHLPNGQDSTEFFAQKALSLAENEDDHANISRAHFTLGSLYWRRDNDYALALDQFKVAREALINSGDTTKLYNIDNGIGVVLMIVGELEEALKYYHLAVNGAQKQNDHSLVSRLQSNMSILYREIGLREKAMGSLFDAIASSRKGRTIDMIHCEITAHLNLIDYYSTDSAFQTVDSIIAIVQHLADSTNDQRSLGRLMVSKLEQAHKQDQHLKVFEIANQMEKKYAEATGYDIPILAAVYPFRSLSHFAAGDLVASDRDLESFKKIIEKYPIKNKVDAIKGLSDVYDERGDKNMALLYFKEYTVLKDSLADEDRKQRLDFIEATHQKEKREQQISFLSEENKNAQLALKQKNLLLLFGALITILGLGVLLLWQQKRKLENQEALNQMEQKILSLQMNPHFIFNAISSIQNYLFDKNDLKKAIRYLSNFSHLMRQTLEHSREKFISLESEIESLKNYLALQKLRFDNGFEYEIEIDQSIDLAHSLVPPLIAQPFVENAIEHGQIYQFEDGRVQISIKQNNDEIIFSIKDNGLGISTMSVKNKNPEATKKSLATTITRERLQLLSKKMKKNFDLQVKADDRRGTQIIINLPIISAA